MGNFRNRGGRGDYRGSRPGRTDSTGSRPNYRSSYSDARPPGSRKRPAVFIDPALLDDGPPQPTWTDLRAAELKEDSMMGFSPLPPGSRPRVGWLLNMVASTVEEPISRRPVQAVDLFFISDEAGGDFRTSIIARPYMYLKVLPALLREVEVALRKKFPEHIAEISVVRLEDHSMSNHLAQDERPSFLKVEARTTGDLYRVREALTPIVRRNSERVSKSAAIDPGVADALHTAMDALDAVLDMREYDVAPVNRLAIDKRVNVGYWYKVSPPGEEGAARDDADDNLQVEEDGHDHDPDMNSSHANDLFSAHLVRLPQIVERASPVVLAYDIECTKKPLKFPDPEAGDEVMMISWMVDGKGYLVINRQVVSKDIDSFDFSPHAEFKGSFEVFNEPDEKAVLLRFFSEVRLAAPRVFVTFNGDFFDWPFVQTRATLLGLDMGEEIAMRSVESSMASKETRGRTAIHMDVLHWVNRDSYLPQGSRGLKAVTRALLGFEPEEIPPEEMMGAAKNRPEEMAKYSVSDAVCTYYLYMKYVHPFTFSLCNIIPLSPDDVLRKGSGTLCEMLLMCQAREKCIVAPNKYNGSAIGKLTEDGHVLESETYIGGHVEAIRTGVFRSDLPLDFKIDKECLADLESTLDDVMKFAITVEGRTDLDDVTNYDEVRAEIVQQLHALRDKPVRSEKPLIYHLDVSAMYPNIILTNRLQPHAIVTPAQCAACDFNGMSECQRDMEWTWRGEYFPASRGEAEMIQRRAALEERDQERKQAESEALAEAEQARVNEDYRNAKRRRPPENPAPRAPKKVDFAALANFNDIESRKSMLFRKRLKDYCRVNYKRTQQTREVVKTATVCQRENPFYVDTVRAFRDRRYEYKALLKKQKKAKAEAKASGDEEALALAENLVVLYDSLQLAHKCILNSFYGYVMRKGARWYSMEMAGIVTNTGGLIIRRAREFIDKVGLPLELDTDGIWCVLPVSFPENFSFKTKSGKKCSMSYICSIFNSDVAANFSNHQYQDLVDPKTFEYNQRSECSILFEVDGPYKAMVLPASLEEGKSIKKRYAVFNDDGSLAELKGFEIKRRGELKLVKQFQGEIFDCFLKGSTLAECYESVGATCNKWLDVIISKGKDMTDDEVLELLVEQNNMSKPLADYLLANQKSCAITCAGRMQEFLGHEIVKDKGLATTYVISRKPEDVQVTARAIPAKIFEFPNEAVRRKLLRKWTKCSDEGLELRNLLDWDYYKGRLANAILKIVSIPAALQSVENPVPRIEYPPWLLKKIREMNDQRKQQTMTSFFAALPKGDKSKVNIFKSLKDAANNTEKLSLDDIEDLPIRSWTKAEIAHRRANAVVVRKQKDQNVFASGKLKGKRRSNVPVFRSIAKDPEVRAQEMRSELLRLIRAPHPDKRHDYKGWVCYAKRIWREQRAARVSRYAAKRLRQGIPMFGAEAEENEDEDTEDRPGIKTGEVVPFGGESFAVKFGMRANRTKRRKLDIPPPPDYNPRNFVNDLQGNLPMSTAFFKKKEIPLLGYDIVWQTVAVAPVMEKPGEYQLWVLPQKKINGSFESGELHSIPLHVRRTLYVNSKLDTPPEIPGATCELVKGHTLPRSQAVHNLFRLELNESRFQNTDKDVTSVIKDVGALDGVFGTQCPLDYEIIVSLGTLCKPSKSILGNLTSRALLRRGLDLTEIIPQSPDNVPYLQDAENEKSTPVLHQAFLFGSHAMDNTSRALYAVVAPEAKLVHIVAVTRGILSVNVKRLWKNIVSKLTENEEDGVPSNPNLKLPSDSQFLATGVQTRDEAWSTLNDILFKVRGNSNSRQARAVGLKTILLAQWPALDAFTASEVLFGARSKKSSRARTFSAVEECVPITKAFPVVRLASNAEDGNYLPVGWESQAISAALGRYADVSNWLENQLLMSRFAGIPIGNVSATHLQAQAIDVLVGRELMNRDHVLWASKAALPDLGGLEEDDSNLQNEVQSVPDISVSGSYRTVCIDTELSNLAVATILASSHVNQLEGTDMAFDAACTTGPQGAKHGGKGAKNAPVKTENKNAAPLDEMASSAPAFRAIKDLVTNWDKAANNSSSPEVADVARGLLDHVHRWTRSEASVLYDPALARFLGWLLKKVFRQLLGELKNLGATIVYASISRIVMATPKTQTLDGLRYAGFLEKTVKEKALFKHIHFQPLIGVYSGLLFVDRFNYGALPAPEETMILSGEVDNLQTKNASSSRVYASRDIPYVRMMWDMARYLPIPVAVLWSQVVEEFIRRPMVQRLKAEEQANSDECEDHVLRATEQRKKRQFRPRGDGFVDEVKHLVKSLTGQLLEKVHEIREKAPTLEFPNVPSVLNGPQSKRRNCALEFVRCLCHVFSLDSASTEEVAAMRRNLLQLLGVREFAKESQFINPALPVPLHDVICTYCNAVVDLDVARDSRLWTESEDDRSAKKAKGSMSWSCEYCGNPYDLRQIELDLLRTAQKLFTSYQVQDLVCKKCKLVKRENMTSHCGCSGSPFSMSVDRSLLRKQLFALQSVAEFHRFEFLHETISWMLSSTSEVKPEEPW